MSLLYFYEAVSVFLISSYVFGTLLFTLWKDNTISFRLQIVFCINLFVFYILAKNSVTWFEHENLWFTLFMIISILLQFITIFSGVIEGKNRIIKLHEKLNNKLLCRLEEIKRDMK